MLALAALLLAQAAAPVPTDLDRQQMPVLVGAATLIQAGKPHAALDALAPALAAYQAAELGERRRTFCASSPTESLLHLLTAAKEKQATVRLPNGYCEAMYLHAFALVDLGRVAEGQAEFAHLVDLAPQNARFLIELANSYRLQKDWDRSIALFRRAAEASTYVDQQHQASQRSRAWRGEAFDLSEQGKFDEAEAIYRRCLTVDPADAVAKRELDWIAGRRRGVTPPASAPVPPPPAAPR